MELADASPRRVTGHSGWEALLRPTLFVVLISLTASILAGAIGAGLILAQSPRYESVSTLVIDQPKAVVAAGSEGVLVKLSNLRLKYAVLLRTKVFTEPIAARVGRPPTEVARSIRSIAPAQSLAFYVTGRAPDPVMSQGLANVAAEELVAYVQREQDAAGIAAGNQIVFTIVVPADIGYRVEPKARRAGVVGATAAFFALLLSYAGSVFITGWRRSPR